MSFILFTTTDLASGRQAEFWRLVSSLRRNADRGIDIKSYILFQNCSAEQLADLGPKLPEFCAPMSTPGRLSLSAARNMMLERARNEHIWDEDDLAGFPDDDAWLPDQVAACLIKVFSHSDKLDLLICRVSLKPDKRAFNASDVGPVSTSQIVRVTTSNSMFIRGTLIPHLGDFDPALGVGTLNGGGEDTDFVIKAYLAARTSGLIDRPIIGHPEPDVASAAKYFRGGLVVLARHARSHPDLMREFVRKIAVGGYFILRQKVSLSTFFASSREAVHAFRSGKRQYFAAPGTSATR